MSFRTNVILGWVLAAIFVGLGLSILTGEHFRSERPEKMGYPIEGVVEEGAEGAAAAPEVPIETLLASADPAKGADVFKQCQSCHTIEAGGAAGIGPNLHAIVGKPIAAQGFAYSDALKGHGGEWSFQNLNEWLHKPAKFASGTKMTFAGLADAQKRADVIAYLNSQGSNLPLPAAPAADAADAPADNAAPAQ